MRQHRIDAVTRAGDGAVDAFTRQKQRAAQPLRTAQIQQRFLPDGGVGQLGKMIEGGNGQHGRDLDSGAGRGKGSRCIGA